MGSELSAEQRVGIGLTNPTHRGKSGNLINHSSDLL